MSPNWFFAQFPPSRSVVENELRQAFWKAGLGSVWLSCVKEEPPYQCLGEWHNQPFTIEWEPGNYVLLKMPDANPNLLSAFERLLKHRALAAYRNGDGQVTVEWRSKDPNGRFAELQTSGAKELERLDR